MGRRKRVRKKKKDRWSNRLAIIGITVVVASLAFAVNVKCNSLRQKDQENQVREASLIKQKEQEELRSKELEKERIRVQTDEYVKQVAREKLGLVDPGMLFFKGIQDKE